MVHSIDVVVLGYAEGARYWLNLLDDDLESRKETDSIIQNKESACQ
jgi:hypothetical protein